jgi:hypothetical protein
MPTIVKTNRRREMGAKLIKFSVEAFPRTRVIGKSVAVKSDVGIDDSTITDLLEGMAQDGSLNSLLGLPERTTHSPDTVGWMGDWHPGAETYTYLAGVLVAPDTPAPDGYTYRDIAECEMAVGWLQETDGDEGGNIFVNASEHVNKAMRANGYEYDGSNGLFEMEYYSHERFRVPQKRGEKVILDFYSPCKKSG